MVVYRLDRQDRITRVNQAFWTFAAANDGSGLQPGSVLGRPLWTFISGVDVVELYRQLLHWVRTRDRTLSFPYRCDSPRARRYLRMTVRPQPDGHVEWRSEIVKVEVRAPLPALLLPEVAVRAAVFRCSLCNRFRHEQQWLEIEQLLSCAQLFNWEKPPGFYYALCGDCRSDLNQRCRLASA